MPSSKSGEPTRRYFTVEEANKSLPYVRLVVSDIVRQLELVNDLKARLDAAAGTRRKPAVDVYNEEIARNSREFDQELTKLSGYIDELTRAGIELKGPDGLCDFLSLRDGRPVYLCWRLGEPTVSHWHEIDAGFSGRQPLEPSNKKAYSGI